MITLFWNNQFLIVIVVAGKKYIYNKKTLLANNIFPTLYACLCLYRSTGKKILLDQISKQ